MDEFLKTLLSKLGEFASTAGLRLVGALLILLVGFKLCKWLLKLIKRTKAFAKLEVGVQTFLASFLGIVLKIMIVLSAISLLGVPMTNFVALLASAGVAIGASLQGSLSNLAGGIMILMFKPFVIGDYIDSAEGSGTVTEITILYTILTTPDNRRIVIPNGAISNEAITNYSYHDLRRLDLSVCVAYDSDVETVKRLLTQTAREHSMVLSEPEAPFCRLAEHGESSLKFALRVWVKNVDYWQVNFDLKESIKSVLDENGIEIPYPQIDVHLDK
ncbi:MAG: mechanosensitive ion channel family protein [Clostridia bacterium]|nr:mechanosensitive ion channel family protein [Clostridia bacterium]